MTKPAQPMLQPRLQGIVEKLCNEGCRQVGTYIREIRQGEVPECMSDLKQQEREQVLNELTSIMSVYDRCDI